MKPICIVCKHAALEYFSDGLPIQEESLINCPSAVLKCWYCGAEDEKTGWYIKRSRGSLTPYIHPIPAKPIREEDRMKVKEQKLPCKACKTGTVEGMLYYDSTEEEYRSGLKCYDCGATHLETGYLITTWDEVQAIPDNVKEPEPDEPLWFLMWKYSGNIVESREYTQEEIKELKNYIAGPYPTKRASWKDMKLLNHFIVKEDWNNFAFTLLMINGVLPQE